MLNWLSSFGDSGCRRPPEPTSPGFVSRLPGSAGPEIKKVPEAGFLRGDVKS